MNQKDVITLYEIINVIAILLSMYLKYVNKNTIIHY